MISRAAEVRDMPHLDSIAAGVMIPSLCLISMISCLRSAGVSSL